MRVKLAIFLVVAPILLLAFGGPSTRSTNGNTAALGNADWRIAAAAPAPKAEHSTEVLRLLAAAKAKGEKELNLSWSEESFSGGEGARMFQALFNRMYGTNIKVNFTPGPAMTQMAGKVTQEVAAGRNTSTDLLLGTESHFSDLWKRNVLEEYDYAKLAPRVKKELADPHGVQIGGIISGVLYNMELIPAVEAPKKLEDVLNPKWKGMVASTANAGIFDRVAARPEWGAEKMKSFVRKLSAQVGGLIRCGEVSRVISGEFNMLVMGCGSFFAHQAQSKGAPLGHAVIEDGTTIGFFYMGVPRTSSNPHLAKLFINMVMSEEGQKVAYKTYFTDHPDLPGSQSAAELKELKAKGKEALRVDVKFVIEHPELRPLSVELRKIIQEKPKG
jgi:ABC-type Fe3+ transport system substrate-binding protein